MGTRLVKRAFGVMPLVKLSGDARAVLVWMAFQARDDDDTPRYFGRREDTCTALGRWVPDALPRTDARFADVERERAAAFQRLKVVLAELVSAGVIERHKRGQRNQRAEYLITIPSPLDVGTSDVPHTGTRDVPHGSTRDVPLAVRETYPQGVLGVTRKNSDQQHHARRASHVRPVERTA